MREDPLEERLAAVERALADGDESVPDLSVPDDLCDRVETLEADVAELEAAVQAVRGYVGSVKHVNDEVEQRADAAMAKAEALERSLADDAADAHAGSPEPAPGGCPRCGAGRRVRDPTPDERRDGPASHERDGHRGATADRDRERTLERGDGQIVDRCDEWPTDRWEGRTTSADPRPTSEDLEENGSPRCDQGSGQVGHRRLAAPDESDGLIARLREVL